MSIDTERLIHSIVVDTVALSLRSDADLQLGQREREDLEFAAKQLNHILEQQHKSAA